MSAPDSYVALYDIVSETEDCTSLQAESEEYYGWFASPEDAETMFHKAFGDDERAKLVAIAKVVKML